MDELSNIITLQDENGGDVNFEFLDLIEYKGEEYVVLLPAEEDEENTEVLILKIVPTENEEVESYVSVDEDTLAEVFAIFREKFKDLFQFES